MRELFNPYKGLSSFDDSERDALFFFGREREREIIAANLIAARLTVLYGETGVGKSSVLRAGVVRHLRELPEPGGVIVFDEWRDDPATALRRQVAAVAGLSPADGLSDTLEASAAILGGEIFVILDGFEEYFLYHGAEGVAGTFLVDFSDAVNRTGLRVAFLLAIREDALAKIDRFKGRIPNLFGNYLRLDHLDRTAASEAIRGPVDRYNQLDGDRPFEIEPGLVEAVLDEVVAGRVELGRAGRGMVESGNGSERIEAPFLQLVMARLWDAESDAGSHVLRLSTLRGLGGAEQIVRDHLEGALDALDAEQQDTAAAIFNHLVTPSGAKIAHDASDLAGYLGAAPARVEPVLATLAAERILRPVPGRVGSERPRYEIYHDILGAAILAWCARHESAREVERVRAAAAKRHRRLLVIALAAVLLAGAMAGTTIFAFSQRGEAQRQAGIARRETRAAQRAAKTLRGKNTVIEKQNKTLETKNNTIQSQNKTLKTKNNTIQSQNKTLKTKSNTIQNQNKTLKTKNNTIQNQNKTLKTKNNTIQNQNKTLKTKNNTIQNQNKTLKTKNNTIQNQNKTLKTKNNTIQSQNNTLKTKNNTIQSQNNTLKTKSNTIQSQNKTLGTRNSQLQTANRKSSAREHAATALAEVSTAPEQALNDALQSAELDPTPAAESVLRTTLNSSRVQAILPGAGTPTAAVAGGGSAFTTRRALRTGDTGGGRSVQTRAVIGNDSVLALGDRSGLRLYRMPSGKLIRKLDVGVPVTHVALTRDGSLLAAASPNGFVSVWDVATGRRLFAPLSHGGRPVPSLAFSHDDKLLATASNDKNVRIWDASTGRLALPLIQHPRAVSLVSFSPDDRFLLTVDGMNARLLEVATGQVVATMTQGRIRTAAFSPDGKLVATGSMGTGATAQLWAVPSGAAVGKPLTGHRGDILSESFSPDGKLLVTASADDTARVWRVPEGTFDAWLVGHGNQVRTAAFSPDAKWIVTASRDRTARVWETDTGFAKVKLAGDRGPLTSAFFTADGRRVVSTSEDGTARIWDPGTAPELKRLGAHAGPVSRVAISPSGKLALSAGGDGTVRFWPLNGGQKTTFELGGTVTTASWSTDGKLILAASDNGLARVWRISNGGVVATLHHGAPIRAAAFSPDASRVVTAGDDGVTRLWKTAGRAEFEELRQGGIVTCVSFSPDGSLVATAGKDGVGRIWQVDGGLLVRRLRGHTGEVVALAFSPDGNWLATASTDKTARIWPVHKNGASSVLHHADDLTSLAFSPDSRRLVTASFDHDAVVWRVPDGKRIKILSGHSAVVSDVAFSSDGRWIVTAGPTTAGLWHASDGLLLLFLHGSGAQLKSVAFSPKGWRVVTGSKDGTVATYDCRLCGGVPQLVAMAKARLTDLGHDLTAAEQKKYLGK